MSQSLPNRRKRLVVNKPVQRRIIVGVTIIPMVALVGATISVAVLTGRVLDEARTAEQSLPTLGPLFVSLFLFIVAAGATVVISALRHSNRIAGPMYRLCKSMREIRDGDVSFTVKLRKGDELTEIADELNAMIAWIREHPPEGVELKLVPDPIANEVVSEEGEVAPSVDDVPSAITTPGREGRPTKR